MKNKQSEEDLKKLIEEDPDFINAPRHNFSLKEFTKNRDDAVKNRHISRLLLIDEAEIEPLYARAIKSLRKLMGVE